MMAEKPDQDAPKPWTGIQALPPTTVRQIGSSQVLVDPTSVVKELIDNALDARATAIFVDLSANTIDSLQVKDNGQGISAPDRALVCRRYCTSKIRDFHDLKDVGGKWLGFRGEAMASMAEMSGAICVTTRVEGESVAVLLKFDRKGELICTERASHPVGTTIKVTDFFTHLPVRKQDALKHSTRFIAKTKRQMQAYALARPAVRFQLRILKAKSDKGNFNYAPTVRANVEDAAFKVIGRDCASQCDWTAIETDDFEICAFLPKPDAVAAKIGGHSAFLSVDSRPVSSSRGTMKKIVATFKEKLRKANPSLSTVKDPFMCMNIVCPPDSYDPNIEPAKDDLLFEDPEVVVQAVKKLLEPFYPETVCDEEEPPTSAQPIRQLGRDASSDIPHGVRESEESVTPRIPANIYRQDQHQWQTSMYGIDEGDLDLLPIETQAPSLDEEDEVGRRTADVSNPWTIAKMNALTKPKKSRGPTQLLTPARGVGDMTLTSSSPSRRLLQVTPPIKEPLTPQTISQLNVSGSSNRRLLQGIQHHSPHSQRNLDVEGPGEARDLTFDRPPLITTKDLPGSHVTRPRPPKISQSQRQFDGVCLEVPEQASGAPRPAVPYSSAAPRRSQRKQDIFKNKPFASPLKGIGDTTDMWFGQPMHNPSTPTASRVKRKPNTNAPPPFPPQKTTSFGPSGSVLDAAERLHDTLTSENNTDIRDFFARKRASQQRAQHNDSRESSTAPSFTPINPHSKNFRSKHRQQGPEDRMTEELEDDGITAQFRAYAEREDPSQRQNKAPGRPRSAPHRRERNVSPSPTPGPSTRPQQRRRTTDHTHTHLTRSKSSKLPLERIPANQRTTSLYLTLSVSTLEIVKQKKKLNMGIYSAGGNSLEWGYPAEECYVDEYDGTVLGRAATETKVREWAGKICGFLDHRFDREDGREIDVVEAMVEGICRGLAERKGDGDGENEADMVGEGGFDEGGDEEMLLI